MLYSYGGINSANRWFLKLEYVERTVRLVFLSLYSLLISLYQQENNPHEIVN